MRKKNPLPESYLQPSTLNFAAAEHQMFTSRVLAGLSPAFFLSAITTSILGDCTAQRGLHDQQLCYRDLIERYVLVPISSYH